MRMAGVNNSDHVFHGAPASVYCPAYAISRAQPAHHLGEASDRRRPSSGGRGVEDAAPYGLCVWVGVSIKPPLPVRRAALDAPVRRDRLRPRLMRCAR